MQHDDLLQKNMSWVYLFNLVFFFLPLFNVNYTGWQYLAMALALVAFLLCYFWAYRCSRQQMHKPTLAIVLIALLITPLNPGSISMFSYAGFFIGYANPLKRYLLLITALLLLLVTLNYTISIYWPHFIHIGLPIVLGVSFLGWVEQQRMLQRLTHQQSADEIKQLATMVERERIARDLHDILGHTLSSIILKADLAEKLLLRQQTAPAQQQLTELSQIAREALSQVRQSVSGYKHQGLSAETAKLLNRLREAEFQVELNGTIPTLDNRTETVLVLALTELVTNVIRHSKGDACQLMFQHKDAKLQIQLYDNGKSTTFNEGNGLQGLRERLAALSGTLTLAVHNGVHATITVPLTEKIA